VGVVVERDGARRADLASIHIAKAKLGWDDDHYRDVLFAVCRVRTAAALDYTGRKLFLAHLRACGWQDGARAGDGAATAQRKPLAPAQRKIWALWQQLADAGLVRNRKMPALAAWCKRQTGVDRIEWLSGAQEALVIESLKRWLVSRTEA